MFKINLEKNKIVSFLKPLNAITKIISNDDGGIKLNFDKTTKECNIFVKKDSIGTLAFIKYKPELLQNMVIDKDETVGVLKVSDFIKYFSVVDNDSVDMQFDANIFSFNESDSEMSFRTADVDMIKEGPKNFKGAAWLAEISIDDKFEKLDRAMNALSDEDCIFISGSAAKSAVTFTVRNSNIELNKYVFKVAAQVAQDFELPFKKELFQTALNMPATTKKLLLAERFISVVGETDMYSMTYFIAKMSQK